MPLDGAFAGALHLAALDRRRVGPECEGRVALYSAAPTGCRVSVCDVLLAGEAAPSTAIMYRTNNNRGLPRSEVDSSRCVALSVTTATTTTTGGFATMRHSNTFHGQVMTCVVGETLV